MKEIDRRKAFQRVKGMTTQQFWEWMNWLHSKAYAKGVQHMEEAMSCHPRISQTMVSEVLEKAEEIRTSWDGMNTVTIEQTEDVDFSQVIKGPDKG